MLGLNSSLLFCWPFWVCLLCACRPTVYLFDIIAVGEETLPDMAAGAHNFWYDHPWVSNDVLVQFLFHGDPDSRGLARNQTTRGALYWSFTEDYAERIIRILGQKRKGECGVISSPVQTARRQGASGTIFQQQHCHIVIGG